MGPVSWTYPAELVCLAHSSIRSYLTPFAVLIEDSRKSSVTINCFELGLQHRTRLCCATRSGQHRLEDVLYLWNLQLCGIYPYFLHVP